MAELLLHYIIPLATLTLLGVHFKKAALASTAAIAPDLDVLLHVHRSCTHSIPLMLAIAMPAILITKKLNKPTATSYAIAATIAALTHPLLDVFDSHTPILWPLSPYSIHVIAEVKTTISSIPTITTTLQLSLTQTSFTPFTTMFDAPIATSAGIIISLILLAAIAIKNARRQSDIG